MAFKVVGYALELVAYVLDNKGEFKPESIYIEAAGKRLCRILASLEASRLKEHPDIDMVVIKPEFFTVTKEYKKED